MKPESQKSAFELTRESSLLAQSKHPNHWHNRAADLHASAGVLWHAMTKGRESIPKDLGFVPGFDLAVACWPVYWMLCGLSLEVVMKAVLVQRGIKEESFAKHGFPNLHRLLGETPSQKERDLFRFYDASLLWAGRYPTPKNATASQLLSYWDLADTVLTEPVKHIKGIELRQGNGVGDWESFHSLWLRYSSQFEHG